MARERWFYAEGHRRMGPVGRQELVEALLQLTDPRTCLVWRRGLHAWMPAADIPELEGLVVSVTGVVETPPPPRAPEPPPPSPVRSHRPAPTRAARPETRRPQGGRGPVLAGAALAAVFVSVAAWFFWPRPAPPEHTAITPAPPPGPGAEGTPPDTAGGSAPPADGGATAAPPGVAPGGSHGFSGWADLEADLPPSELKRLRGVGGWSGDKLTVTLYNGSSWRVTEIFVLTSRMEGDRFVDSVAPHLLLPVGGAPVEGAVKDLLQKVAPDRKRAGVNPADTGPFEVVLGAQPAAYRWKIERARGYPPRGGE